ncbi:MAG TPA: FMN-dependent NADH-azoreductase [Burkholderiaceae bacterium]
MPHTILHIDSSPMGERSFSRKLGAKVLSELQVKFPGSILKTRDLAAQPLPHLSARTLGAFFTPPEQRTPELVAAAAESDAAIAELKAADIVVIGAPMWNFGIPSSLKAWIDHVARAGHTFKYGANGPEGMLDPAKKVIIVSSRGGVYSAGPMAAMDFQEDYLRSVLGFLGLRDISFVRTEGVALGEDAAKSAVQAAESHVAEVLA